MKIQLINILIIFYYFKFKLNYVYECLDIAGLKTTPFHPECNGQSERTVQSTKVIIRSHVDENQSN